MTTTYRIRYRLIALLLLMMFVKITAAQQTLIYSDPERLYKSAIDLYNKQKYSAAIESFENALSEGNEMTHMARINCQYYSAVCSAELFNPDAEPKLLRFINEHPSESKSKLACYQLAKWYFRKKQFRKSSEYFNKSDILMLSNVELEEYYFKSGYSYFMNNDLSLASRQFKQILNTDSKYSSAANYYYAHIAFASGNQEEALNAFSKLSDSEVFSPLAPYYIVQIYFQQQKYEKLMTYANEALAKPDVKNAVEIKRILTEAYYLSGNYAKAAVGFEEYKQLSTTLNRDDLFKLGYSHYRAGNYAKAIDNLQRVVNVDDTLAQNAVYHLADCYLKSGNKNNARNAYQQAAGKNFNSQISEESLYNYAMLSYELGFTVPAINAFNQYIKNYNHTARVDKSYQYLAQLYLTSNDYKSAMAALDSVKSKNRETSLAYQRIAYNWATDLFNDRDYSKSISLFEKAIVNKANEQLAAKAIYWKAEALFKQKRYDAALKQYRIFIFYPASLQLDFFNRAHYDLGYCNFKLEQWSESATWFRKFLSEKNQPVDYHISDANARLGDAYFMMKDYEMASRYYRIAVDGKVAAADYCYFQLGMISGLQGNAKDKIEFMNRIQNNYRSSTYYDDATYEHARVLLDNGNQTEALNQFQHLLKEYPQSNYARQAKLKSALIYFNLGEDENAERTYKEVVMENPKSMEGSEALNGLKNLYVKQGAPEKLKLVYDQLPLLSLSEGSQDSIFYESAEQSLLKEDYNKAISAFEAYLEKFPEGSFKLNATFYLAECQLKQKQSAKALAGYEAIIEYPRNTFTEKSLLRAASLNYSIGNYEKALMQFQKLEQVADIKDNILLAYAGQLRSSFALSKCDETVVSAQKILKEEKCPAEMIHDANYFLGKCALMREDLIQARQSFREVEKLSGERSAEARYSLALILFKEKKFKESSKKAFEVINQDPAYDFWRAKSFILLGDNYLALADTFQAKSTWKSIIDNYEAMPGDKEDIIAIAREKYDAIVVLENRIFRKSSEEDLIQQTDSIE